MRLFGCHSAAIWSPAETRHIFCRYPTVLRRISGGQPADGSFPAQTRIQRAPQEVSSLGCAWAVRVPAADGLRAAALLRAALRPVSGTYRLHPNGYLEEAAL